MRFVALDHVQLCMPSGAEERARAFYCGVLGMEELPKPADGAAGRGGCWFVAGTVHLHLGPEEPFRPALRAHPAITVDDLEGLRRRLEAAGLVVTDGKPIPGRRRVFSTDCFGNRMEWVQLGDGEAGGPGPV